MLKINLCKYMANASFYRPKSRTIDWWPSIDFVASSWHYCWLIFDVVGWFCCWFLILLAGFWCCWLLKTSLLTSELEPFVSSKLWAIVLAFQQKKPDLIWTSRTRDMTRKPNRARAVRTASDVSVVSTIWTWKRQIWVLDSSWKL